MEFVHRSAPNILVNLIAPGEMPGDRVNQFDLRVGKSLRLGERRAIVSLDLYNAMNGDTVLSYNETYIPDGRWLIRPRC